MLRLSLTIEPHLLSQLVLIDNFLLVWLSQLVQLLLLIKVRPLFNRSVLIQQLVDCALYLLLIQSLIRRTVSDLLDRVLSLVADILLLVGVLIWIGCALVHRHIRAGLHRRVVIATILASHLVKVLLRHFIFSLV